jgi:hypothetical protein
VSNDLRPIFEAIIREAISLLPAARSKVFQTANQHKADHIIALAEEGISRISHACVETKEPFWEEHGPPENRTISRRWMVEISVDHLRFNPHLENGTCRFNGCQPAMPSEIPHPSIQEPMG